MTKPSHPIPHLLKPSPELVTESAKELSRSHYALKDTSSSPAKRRLAVEARGYRSRRNDAVTRNQKRKRPNAQKHGVFSVSPVIAGEDPREFEKLHSALIGEWTPSGPTEEEAVFSLADAMWRKRRTQKFVQAKVIANTLAPCHPAFDEAFGLVYFIHLVGFEPETAFEKRSTCLRADKVNYLNQKFPRSNYKSTSEWAEAVKDEIQTVLLPAAAPSLYGPEPAKEPDDLTAGFRHIIRDFQLVTSIIHANQFLEYDLDLQERLDARIARLVKHLVQTKVMKQMLHQTGA
jgi:hypothetical protein